VFLKKQGTPNDGANVENILTIRQKKYIDVFNLEKQVSAFIG